jgi:hypothetical protein
MDKRTIRVPVSGYIDLEDTAINLIAGLQKLIDQYGQSVYIRREILAYDTSESTVIYIDRIETDKEFQERIEKENIYSEQRKAQELSELSRLQAKYKDQ